MLLLHFIAIVETRRGRGERGGSNTDGLDNNTVDRCIYLLCLLLLLLLLLLSLFQVGKFVLQYKIVFPNGKLIKTNTVKNK